ncbi:MAG: hypothetical protein HYX66_00645 [Ignavibacteria bacterium]|nr:hypothetical protein [Ignavibacteria bacterium]
MMKYLIILTSVIVYLQTSPAAFSQVFESPVVEEGDLPLDTLVRKSEWWLGVQGSAFYAMNYGTLSEQIIGGTAPDQPGFVVKPQGGYGYGIGGGLALEFRPIHSDLGFLVTSGVDWRWAKAETQVPISNDIYAKNALFESQSTVLYVASAMSAKVQLGVTGMFVLAGFTYDVPLKTLDSYVWQNEKWEGEPVSNQPGAPQTSIKFNTQKKFESRIGLQIGFGHDFQAGLFGYKGQVVTPFIVIQGATPMITAPTTWNNISARLGFIWRAGL